jgi:hypothetical protein
MKNLGRRPLLSVVGGLSLRIEPFKRLCQSENSMRLSYSATILSFGILIAGIVFLQVDVSTHLKKSLSQPFQLRWNESSDSTFVWQRNGANPPLPVTGSSSTLLRRTEESASTDSSLVQQKHSKGSSKKDEGKGKSTKNDSKGSGKGKSSKDIVDPTDTLIIARVGIVCDEETDSRKGSKGKSDKSNKGSSAKGSSAKGGSVKGSRRRRILNSDTVVCSVESLSIGLLDDQFSALQGVCPNVASLDSPDGDVEISSTCVDNRRELLAVARTRRRPRPSKDEDEEEGVIVITSPTTSPTASPVAVTKSRIWPRPGKDEDEVEEVIATAAPAHAPTHAPTNVPTASPVAATRKRIRPTPGKDEDEVEEVIATAAPTSSPVATKRTRRRRPGPGRDEDEEEVETTTGEEADVENRDEESGEKAPDIFQFTTSRCDDGIPTQALAVQSVGDSLSCIILEFEQQVDFSDLAAAGLSPENRATVKVSPRMKE